MLLLVVKGPGVCTQVSIGFELLFVLPILESGVPWSVSSAGGEGVGLLRHGTVDSDVHVFVADVV